jgi:hypothetical protein
MDRRYASHHQRESMYASCGGEDARFPLNISNVPDQPLEHSRIPQTFGPLCCLAALDERSPRRTCTVETWLTVRIFFILAFMSLVR